jgi:hypothetical protein
VALKEPLDRHADPRTTVQRRELVEAPDRRDPLRDRGRRADGGREVMEALCISWRVAARPAKRLGASVAGRPVNDAYADASSSSSEYTGGTMSMWMSQMSLTRGQKPSHAASALAASAIRAARIHANWSSTIGR